GQQMIDGCQHLQLVVDDRNDLVLIQHERYPAPRRWDCACASPASEHTGRESREHYCPLVQALLSLRAIARAISLSPRGQHPKALGDRNGLRERSDLELLHHGMAMGLDGALGHPELERHLFVEPSPREQQKDLSFARRERGHERAKIVELT